MVTLFLLEQIFIFLFFFFFFFVFHGELFIIEEGQVDKKEGRGRLILEMESEGKETIDGDVVIARGELFLFSLIYLLKIPLRNVFIFERIDSRCLYIF